MELCEVFDGQIMRKQFPQEKTNEMVQFSTKKPRDRLTSIMNGLGVSVWTRTSSSRNWFAHYQVLSYGQSEYIRVSRVEILWSSVSHSLCIQSFGLDIDTRAPLSVSARVLDPPKLMYGGQQPTVVSVVKCQPSPTTDHSIADASRRCLEHVWIEFVDSLSPTVVWHLSSCT